MTTPTEAVTSAIGSFYTAVSSAVSSATSAVVSAVNSCYTAARNGIVSVSNSTCDAVKNAYTFTANKCAENPKISKVALGAIATIGVAAAAYAGRSYLPALPASIANLGKKAI